MHTLAIFLGSRVNCCAHPASHRKSTPTRATRNWAHTHFRYLDSRRISAVIRSIYYSMVEEVLFIVYHHSWSPRFSSPPSSAGENRSSRRLNPVPNNASWQAWLLNSVDRYACIILSTIGLDAHHSSITFNVWLRVFDWHRRAPTTRLSSPTNLVRFFDIELPALSQTTHILYHPNRKYTAS